MNWSKYIFFWRKPRPVQEAASPPRRVEIPAPEPPAWTDDDTIAFRKFLHSETGLRFVAKSRAMEYNRAVALARDPFNPAHNAGVVTGISDTIKWMLSLSELKISQAFGDSNANTTAGAEQDDDALLKQYSP